MQKTIIHLENGGKIVGKLHEFTRQSDNTYSSNMEVMEFNGVKYNKEINVITVVKQAYDILPKIVHLNKFETFINERGVLELNVYTTDTFKIKSIAFTGIIDLVNNPTRIGNKEQNEYYKYKFKTGVIDKRKENTFSTELPQYNLKAGDKIVFMNGYNVLMQTEILAFDKDNDAYLLWDCYWTPIDLKYRLIKVLSK